MTRTALLHCGDQHLTDAVARRLTADGFAVLDSGTTGAAAAGAGSLDALVCAVARPAPADFPGRDPREWYAEVSDCLTPAFQLVRAAVPALRRAGGGRIVLLGGGWATADRPGHTAAAAVDGAVVALVKTLARDLGPDGISVNEVVCDPADPPAPDAVAAAVGYLCRPEAGAVVGQLLTLGRGGYLRP